MMRLDDTATTGFQQNQRIIPFNNNWWFRTREGDIMGPYPSEIQAEEGIEVYIALVSEHFEAA